MEIKEAKFTIRYLESYYKNGEKINNVQENIYTDYLLSLKNEYFKLALKDLIKNEVYFPKIATINNYYTIQIQKHKYKDTFKYKNDPKYKCVWCDSKGYHLQRDAEGYEYIYYCTECSLGSRWKYDGREKNSPTEYFNRGINEIYDVANYNKKATTQGAVPIQKIQQMMKDILNNNKIS